MGWQHVSTIICCVCSSFIINVFLNRLLNHATLKIEMCDVYMFISLSNLDSNINVSFAICIL